MQPIEEKYARFLHGRLVKRFVPVAWDSEITLDRWRCLAQRRQRSCIVVCLDSLGPEFLTYFEEEKKTIARGITASPDETVEAIWQWLGDVTLDALHAQLNFVDGQRRELLRVRDSALKHFPVLESAIKTELGFISERNCVRFLGEIRSIHLSFDGNNKFPDAVFCWDQGELFSFKVKDPQVFGAVLTQWVVGNHLPSRIKSEFPWLKVGRVAECYENGNPVEGEFIQSWDRMEEFFDSKYFRLKRRVLPFLAELRRAGYERKLRAGQSMWLFGVSRSRRHGLRPEQPCVFFEFREDTMQVVSNLAEETSFTSAIAMSRQVEEVLARLAGYPID